MNRRPGPDLLLYVLAAACTVIGLLAIWDSGYARAAVDGKIFPREFLFQSGLSLVAVLFGWGASKVPVNFWKKMAPTGLVLAIFFLLLVEVPGLGVEIGGARRWIGVGSVTVQPAEFAKLAVIVFLAWAFSVRQPWTQPAGLKNFGDRIDRVWIPKIRRGLALLVPVGIVVFLIEKEPDMATAMVCVACMLAMFVIGGVTWKSLMSLGAVGLVLAGGLVMKEPYRLERVTSHAHRWESQYIETVGYQTTQSEIALASGGLIGVGLGEGRAKHKLPAPTTDFILATIGEEFGLIGSGVVLLMLAALTLRLVWLGMGRAVIFDRLVLCGVAVWVGVQATTNVMMANGSFPPIGIPLPFFSYGGSSLIALWLAIGVSQSVLCRQGRAAEASDEASEGRGRASSRGRRSGGLTRDRERVASLR